GDHPPPLERAPGGRRRHRLRGGLARAPRAARSGLGPAARIGAMTPPDRTSLSFREAEAEEIAETPAGLPARRDDLRPYLPGVEPERQVNDWGRSERVEGFLDRALVDFFYNYWFRAEVEGIENVPATGGALLVSNHSGALPPDAAMIGKAS